MEELKWNIFSGAHKYYEYWQRSSQGPELLSGPRDTSGPPCLRGHKYGDLVIHVGDWTRG